MAATTEAVIGRIFDIQRCSVHDGPGIQEGAPVGRATDQFEPIQGFRDALSERPRGLRAFIFGSIGVGVILFGIWELNRSMLKPFLRP